MWEKYQKVIKFLILSLVLYMVCALSGLVQAQEEPGRVKQNLLKAVVKILLTDQSGQKLVGTGFLVSREIIRNGHAY